MIMNDMLDVAVSGGIITLTKPCRHKTLEESVAEFDGKLLEVTERATQEKDSLKC